MFLTYFLVALIICLLILVAATRNKDITPGVPKKKDGNDDAQIQALKSENKEEKSKEDEMLKAILGMYSKERSVSFFVNGGKYRTRAAQEQYCMLEKGMDLSLRTEPENRYDKYAVKVFSDRKHIGYVSKDESKLVFQVVEQRCVSDCVIIDNDFAEKNNIPSLMHARLFIKPKFVNHWSLEGYDDPDDEQTIEEKES